MNRKKIILSSLFLLFLVSAILPRLALAQETEADRCKDVKKASDEIPLNVPIPIITENCCWQEYKDKNLTCVKDIGEYLIVFYKYFSGIVGILSAVMIVYAGIQWIVAAGNSSSIERAKTTMNGAAIGLVLTLSAFLILNTINPELVSMRIPELGHFEPVYVGSNFCADMPEIEALPIPENIPCGQTYELSAVEGEASYSQDFCCGRRCGPNGAGKPQLCAIAKGQTIPEDVGCPEKCLPASEVCYQTNKNECEKTDAFFKEQKIDYNGTPMVCRKVYRGGLLGNPDSCVYTYQVPENACGSLDDDDGWSKISCTYFGLENDVDTPCWSVNEPENVKLFSALLTTWINGFCTDDPRAGRETDAFCCAKKDKTEISCRDHGKGDEVEVPCNQPVLGNTVSFDDMNTEHYDDDGPVTCSNRCWLELQLQYWKSNLVSP